MLHRRRENVDSAGTLIGRQLVARGLVAGGRAGRARQHQPRPDPDRRQLPEDTATLMSASSITAVAIVAAFVVAAVVVRIVHVVMRRMLERMETVSAENRAALQARARQLIRALEMLAYGIAALASISLALSRFGVSRACAGSPGYSRVAADPRAQHRHHHGRRDDRDSRREPRDRAPAAPPRQRRAQSDLEWQRRASTLGGILTRLVTVGGLVRRRC